MAAPNIVNVTTITGRTTGIAVSSAVTVLVANAAASSMCLKVNTVIFANVDGTNACDVTMAYNTSAGGAGSSFKMLNTVSVPADASLIAIDKNSQIYLEEGKSLIAYASTSNDIEAVISYEEIASG